MDLVKQVGHRSGSSPSWSSLLLRVSTLIYQNLELGMTDVLTFNDKSILIAGLV